MSAGADPEHRCGEFASVAVVVVRGETGHLPVADPDGILERSLPVPN
ncbi:hypothetical protein OG352_03265 [Streptomyces sp. NBC_01485]|nr:hypothetical protein [Streptomyces sp. NBC_01485]